MMSSFSTVKFASDEVIDRFLANVDVWQTIFEMLSVKDRIRLEKTNKRLHILMLACWKRVTSFDSRKCLREMSDNSSMKIRWATLLAICVDQIGYGLRSLMIHEDFPSTVCSVTLPSIGEGCPNVETINFVFMGEGTLDVHFDSFSHLKTLTVSHYTGDQDYFAFASASVFLSIPTSIEMIRGLEGMWEEEEKVAFESAAQIEGFFAHRPSLREIYLGDLDTRDRSKADIFRVIAERCPHLKSITLSYSNCIDYSGVVALESMKELRIRLAFLDELEIVTVCERSPLVEALEFRWHPSSNIDLQSTALNALGSLTKLVELHLENYSGDRPATSLVTEFVCKLGINSGTSLRRVHLDYMPLQTAAIEALANGCPKLRHVEFDVREGKATPASIRFLIDCIVAHPSWIPPTDWQTLLIRIGVIRDRGVDAEALNADFAAFKALAAPGANLPAGVRLIVS